MYKSHFIFILFYLMLIQSMAQTQIIRIYPEEVPNSLPNQWQEKEEMLFNNIPVVSSVSEPTLTVFKPAAGKANGTSVIICPGGGYQFLAIHHEGYDVARQFAQMGVTAFVLKYRLPDNVTQKDQTITPLLDAQHAIRLVRKKALQMKLKPNRVGILGFSAGGHLAASAGTHFSTSIDGSTDTTGIRPDFMILVYPVISFKDSLTHEGSRNRLLSSEATAQQIKFYSSEEQVTAATPPTFLIHCADDQTVKVQNSLVFYEACLSKGIPVEMHLYAKGGHGFGLINSTTPDRWMERVRSWMKANSWLKTE